MYQSASEINETEPISMNTINTTMMPVSTTARALLKHETLARTLRRRRKKAYDDAKALNNSLIDTGPLLNENTTELINVQATISHNSSNMETGYLAEDIQQNTSESDFYGDEISQVTLESDCNLEMMKRETSTTSISTEKAMTPAEDDGKFEATETHTTLSIKFPNPTTKKLFMAYCRDFIRIVK